jgi:hypothetical protein
VASGPVFMFCAPKLVFSGIEGVVSLFYVFALPDSFSEELRASVSFSCFARPDSFTAVSSASGAVFMFYTPEIIFDGT